ncbi:hypothetical protein GN956_G24816 [Arapaima gigas]
MLSKSKVPPQIMPPVLREQQFMSIERTIKSGILGKDGRRGRGSESLCHSEAELEGSSQAEDKTAALNLRHIT